MAGFSHLNWKVNEIEADLINFPDKRCREFVGRGNPQPRKDSTHTVKRAI